MEEGGSAPKILTRKHTRNRPLARSRHRWGRGGILNGSKEIGVSAKIWIDLAQDGSYWRAFVNPVLKLRVPKAT